MSKGYHARAGEFGEAMYANACRGKAHYPSKRRADGEIRVLIRLGRIPDDGTMNSYKCRACKSWHIGHRPGSGRASRAPQ